MTRRLASLIVAGRTRLGGSYNVWKMRNLFGYMIP